MMKSPMVIRGVRRRTWLAGILVLLLFPNAFAQTDFSAFWKKFKSAVIAGDKAAVVEMTKFPVSMPYSVKSVKNKEDFLRRYNEIFKGEANAAQCSRAENREENPRSGMRSTAHSRIRQTTGKMLPSASSLN